MNGSVLLYVLVALVAIYYLRRLLITRSIRTYSPAEVDSKLRETHGILLLDVRTEKEWNHGHLKGAVHIPLHELGRRFEELDRHKNKEIICYCQTGNRSLTAALRLKRLGFTVAHMKGGIAEWNFQNFRSERSS